MRSPQPLSFLCVSWSQLLILASTRTSSYLLLGRTLALASRQFKVGHGDAKRVKTALGGAPCDFLLKKTPDQLGYEYWLLAPLCGAWSLDIFPCCESPRSGTIQLCLNLSHGVASENSPQRKLWVECVRNPKAPDGATEAGYTATLAPLRGWNWLYSRFPRLAPWATFWTPLRGFEQLACSCPPAYTTEMCTDPYLRGFSHQTTLLLARPAIRRSRSPS